MAKVEWNILTEKQPRGWTFSVEKDVKTSRRQSLGMQIIFHWSTHRFNLCWIFFFVDRYLCWIKTTACQDNSVFTESSAILPFWSAFSPKTSSQKCFVFLLLAKKIIVQTDAISLYRPSRITDLYRVWHQNDRILVYSLFIAINQQRQTWKLIMIAWWNTLKWPEIMFQHIITLGFITL